MACFFDPNRMLIICQKTIFNFCPENLFTFFVTASVLGLLNSLRGKKKMFSASYLYQKAINLRIYLGSFNYLPVFKYDIDYEKEG